MGFIRVAKTVVAWACIAALVVFCAMNTQSTTVTVLGAELTAPLAVIVALAAVLGALLASGFKTMLTWARAKPDD